MSQKTKRRLSRFADTLEAIATTIINSIELILVDAVYGKGKYRKRGAKLRPIIHRTYNRTVVVREPLPSERLHIVRGNR